MLLLTLLTAAWAGDCAERLTPDALRARLEALEPDVFYAVEGTQEQLFAMEGLLDGCLDGPVGPETLTRLWLTLGVAEHFFQGEIGPEGQLRLGSAFGLGGPEAWPSAFGAELQPEFLSSAVVVVGGATIELAFSEQDIVFVDGEIRYERGTYSTTPGLHVVQWQEQGAWTGALLRLERGGTARVGQVSPSEVSTADAEGDAPQKTRERPEREPKERPEREPRERPERAEVPISTRALLSGGYGVAVGEIESDEGAPAGGYSGLPMLALRAEVDRSALWVGLDALGAAPTPKAPAWPGSVSLLGGARLHPGVLQLRVGLGPVLTATPGVNERAEEPKPEFSSTLAAGGRVMLAVELPEHRLQPGVRASVDLCPGLRVPSLEPSLVVPVGALRLSVGLQASLLMADQAQLFRTAALVGVRWEL